jgi:large subunit ribosomal protein L25
MYLFRDLVYTQEAKLVELNVDGTVYKAILQDLQIHSVSEVLLHVDFLQIFEDKLVKIEIPIRTSGVSVGVQKGGKLVVKQPKLKVLALPKDLPDFIDVDVSKLDLGKSARVSEVKLTNFTILNPGSLPIVSVAIPRALRGKQTEETAAAGGKKKK